MLSVQEHAADSAAVSVADTAADSAVENAFDNAFDHASKSASGPKTDPAELALLARIGQGDERALVDLHRRYARRIYSFVLHQCGDPELAESLVSETLFEVWRRPQAYRGEARLSTWLLGIARNRMLSALRSRSRGPGRDEDDIDDLADALASDEPDGAACLLRSQTASLLHQCLDTLTRVQRECMHLVFFEEQSLTEVAAVQRVPEGTVKTRLFHARKAMKTCMEAALR